MGSAVTPLPLTIANIQAYFFTSYSAHMFQESAVGSPSTPADNDGEAFGTENEQGPNAYLIQATADANRPTLTTRSSVPFASFTAASNHFMEFQGTTTAFNWIHQSPNIMTLIIIWEVGANGVQYDILDNTQASSALSGIFVRRGATNVMTVGVTRNVLGNLVYSDNTAATVLVASGRVCTVIQTNGASGMDISPKYPGDSFEHTARLNAPNAIDAPSNLTIGRDSIVGTNPMTGFIHAIMLYNRVLTTAELDLLCAFTPARTSVPIP